MAEVAEIFSKGLNEPFVVYDPFHGYKGKAVFDANGFKIKERGEWHYDAGFLIWLLTGGAKILEE
jgi:hypothetical protein